MNKLFSVLAMVALVLASQACATTGYSRLPGLAIPGYDDLAYVTASNMDLVDSIGRSYGAPYGYLYGDYPYGNVPVCRLQDLSGLPPVSQPVIVRLEKNGKHQKKDIIGSAAVGAALAYLASDGDLVATGIGGGAGAGVGLLVTNHEYDYCLYLPAANFRQPSIGGED